ncbi:MAG TPA: NAD+ synthase [Anaerolineales bacterium]|nr:NAD+ synthase [Anaerolineales bacterium]
MNPLEINTGLARKILTGFIKTEITRAGFSHAVIGLSGGVDSALACILAAEALGPENVLALQMPYKDSSPDSLEHAQLVVALTGVKTKILPITEMVDPVIDQIPEADRVRRGNAMARSRMILLYDGSADFKGLVVGTGNKTELLLGYSTQFGDAACALNPLGDLYKTQLLQLAWAVEVPEAILQKPPSADLWKGQTDEGDLGFTYDEVDRLLFLLVDQRYSPEECIAAGFAEPFVRDVIGRIRRNHFKRVMPPIAKLSNRTIGYDFLYLRDWGT